MAVRRGEIIEPGRVQQLNGKGRFALYAQQNSERRLTCWRDGHDSAQPFARNRTIAVDKLTGRHRLLALKLELKQFQCRAASAAGEQLFAFHSKLCRWQSCSMIGWLGHNQLQILSTKASVRSRPGLKTTQPVVNLL